MTVLTDANILISHHNNHFSINNVYYNNRFSKQNSSHNNHLSPKQEQNH